MTTETVESVEAQIRKLEKKKDELITQVNQLRSLGPEIELAEFLHDITCNSNHIDMCGWEYEKWSDFGKVKLWTKDRHVAWAKRMLETCTDEEIRRVLSAMKGTRYVSS
jgi:hypothetical protein